MIIDYREMVEETLRNLNFEAYGSAQYFEMMVNEITENVKRLNKIAQAMNGSNRYFLRSTQVISKAVYDYLEENDWLYKIDVEGLD